MTLLCGPILTAAVRAQPAQGNWVVAGTQVVQNESVTLNGNLTVQSGGNLTLRNVNLAMNVHSDGQYWISVEPGGSLYIFSSKIASGDQSHRFSFIVNGTNFVLQGSTLQFAGRCVIQGDSSPSCSQGNTYDGTQGLLVLTNGASIKNNTISKCGFGLILAGFHDSVIGNTIASTDFASIMVGTRPGGSLSFNNATVIGNTFNQDVLLDSSIILLSSSGGNLVTNNTITSNQVVGGVTLFGVTDTYGYANTIEYNQISTTAGMLITGWAADDLVLHNSVSYCEAGIEAWDTGSSNVIEANTLRFGRTSAYNGHICGGPGIQVMGLRDSAIEGNQVVGAPGNQQQGNSSWAPAESIFLDQVFQSRILDNNLTFSVAGVPPFYLLDSSGNAVQGNMVWSPYTSAWASAFLFTANNDTLSDNSFNSSAPYSIALDQSSGNSVYGNDFLGSATSAYDGGNGNLWSVNGVGNYWANGGGSTSYSVPPNGTDAHPLVSPVAIVPVQLFTPDRVAPPQPFGATKGFQVSNTTIIRGGSRIYNTSNFAVLNGGNLTYVGVNLQLAVGGAYPYPMGLNVQQGGALNIVNCNVTWGAGFIQIASGGRMVIKNSVVTVSGTQFGAMAFEPAGALSILSSTLRSAPGAGGFLIRGGGNATLIISNSTLNGGSHGFDYLSTIAMGGPGVSIDVENTLLENLPAGIHIDGSGSTLTAIHDTFKGVSLPFDAFAGSATIENDLVYSSTLGIQVTAGSVTMQGNTLLRSWWGGIGYNCQSFYSSARCGKVGAFTGNTMMNALGQMGIAANNTVVADNRAINSEYGLGVTGSNNQVFNNTVMSTSAKPGISIVGTGNAVYHNNFYSSNPNVQPGNTYSMNGEGNYWGGYSGKDANLDGIGDTPFTNGNVVVDNYPFMKPDGWLTKFFLTVNTGLPAATQFSINGSAFKLAQGGAAIIRLGYVAKYNISLPQSVALGNGTSLVFAKWSDGTLASSRTISLSSNATLSATYTIAATTTTTTVTSSTTTTSTTTSTSTTSTTASSSTTSTTVVPPANTTTASSANPTSSSTSSSSTAVSSTVTGVNVTSGGIPEFSNQLVATIAFTVIIIASFVLVRGPNRFQR